MIWELSRGFLRWKQKENNFFETQPLLEVVGEKMLRRKK